MSMAGRDCTRTTLRAKCAARRLSLAFWRVSLMRGAHRESIADAHTSSSPAAPAEIVAMLATSKHLAKTYEAKCV